MKLSVNTPFHIRSSFWYISKYSCFEHDILKYEDWFNCLIFWIDYGFPKSDTDTTINKHNFFHNVQMCETWRVTFSEVGTYFFFNSTSINFHLKWEFVIGMGFNHFNSIIVQKCLALPDPLTSQLVIFFYEDFSKTADTLMDNTD